MKVVKETECVKNLFGVYQFVAGIFRIFHTFRNLGVLGTLGGILSGNLW